MSVELLCIRRTRAKPVRWVTELLAVALVLIGALPTSARSAAEYPEDAVKAVFLYRFAGYVSWPEATAGAPQFTIAVLGADDVAKQLRTYLPEHPIQGKPAHVATIQGLSQLGDAEMLYIGPRFPGKLSVLIDALRGRPILIVTDRPGALDEGSMVNFLIEQQHVRFEISTSAAKRSSLLIGSGLLAVAERVETGDLRGRSECRPFTESDSPCPQRSAALIYGLGHRKGG
jgi:hypothetical protein